MKIPRSKDEPGKGGFWKLDLDRLDDGQRSRRRLGTHTIMNKLLSLSKLRMSLLVTIDPADMERKWDE